VYYMYRLWMDSRVTINFDRRGVVCGISSVVGNTRSYSASEKVKKRQYADIENTLFLLVWGSNPMVVNKGPTYLAPKITNAIMDGMQMAVVDLRFSNTEEKAQM